MAGLSICPIYYNGKSMVVAGRRQFQQWHQLIYDMTRENANHAQICKNTS